MQSASGWQKRFADRGKAVAKADGGARYEVLAIRYGTRLTSKRDVFLHFDQYGEPDGTLRMDYFFWVARNGRRTIVIDCGFNEGSGARRGRTMLCPPPAALQRIGIAPADVDLLVVTHAHYDHAGNIGAFPSARVVMSAREYEFWTGEIASRPLFASVAEGDDIAALRRVAAAGRMSFVYGAAGRSRYSRQPIADGIDVVEVGGHTPGQLVVLVDTEHGPVVLASDALHYYEQLTLDRPFTHVTDLPATYAALQYLRDLQAGGAQVVAGHDPLVAEQYPALAGHEGATRIGPTTQGRQP